MRVQPGQVSRCFFVGHQHGHLAGAQGDGAQPQVNADAGGVPQGLRDHAGRHALQLAQLRGAAQCLDGFLAAALAVKQQAGVAPARFGIGAQQGFQAHALFAGARVGIGQRTGRANRGAGAAAHAQIRVDLDLLTVFFAADGAGRTDVYAGIAAHGFVAAVGANFLLVGKELGLFKLTDHVAQLDHCGQQTRRGQAREAGQRKVALRRRMQRDQRLRTQVQHQVEGFAQRLRRAPEVDGTGHLAHRHAGALRIAFGTVDLVAEINRALGAGHHAGIAARAQVEVNRVGLVPLELKSAQPARQLQRLSADDRVLALLRGRRRVAGNTLRKNCHAERV